MLNRDIDIYIYTYTYIYIHRRIRDRQGSPLKIPYGSKLRNQSEVVQSFGDLLCLRVMPYAEAEQHCKDTHGL